MGWPVSKTNSYQFKVGADTLALACIQDQDLPQGNYDILLCVLAGGEWLGFGGAPILRLGISNRDIEAVGTVHDYLVALMPLAEALVRDNYLPVKPDPATFQPPFGYKLAALSYDLAMGAVTFNPETMKFTVSDPPLPHASP